jgi:hypothetical protein
MLIANNESESVLLLVLLLLSLLGDEVRLTCWFDSETEDKYRNHTLYFGEGSDVCVECLMFNQCFTNYTQTIGIRYGKFTLRSI